MTTHSVTSTSLQALDPPITSSKPETQNFKASLISEPATDADRFLNELYQENKIDNEGWLRKAAFLPEMPVLLKTSMERVDFVLSRVVKLWAHDIRKDLPCKQLFRNLDLINGRIYLVGGIVLWILGSEGLFEAGRTLIGKQKFPQIYQSASLSQFDKRKGDIDSRYVEKVKETDKVGDPLAIAEKFLKETDKVGDPLAIAEKFLKSLAKEFAQSSDESVSICDELRKKGGPFKKYHPFFDLDQGALDRHAFLISHENGSDLELDLMLASFLKENTLLTIQDLHLDITDYVLDRTKELRVSGMSYNGWQGIIAVLGKLIQFQSLTPQAWVRAQSKKIFSYRSLSPFPEELYKKMKVRSLGTILQNIATGHLNQNPVAVHMLLIDCASDLLRHGIHPVDVDRICQSVKTEAKLPFDLQSIRRASQVLPMELILAVLRLSGLRNMNACQTGNKTYMRWNQDGSECVIQLSLEQSIETLISYEMRMLSSQFPRERSALIELLGDMVASEKQSNEALLALQIVERKYPDLIAFACDSYFKNREADVQLAFKLIGCLEPVHFRKALQMYGMHLHHTKNIGKEHMEYFERISKMLISGHQCREIEAINLMISLGQSICQSNQKFNDQTLKIIEMAVNNFLEQQRPKFAAYLLKLAAEAGLKSGDSQLWLQCIEGIFKQKNGFQDAFKLWIFAERHELLNKRVCTVEYVSFFLDFIQALYKQNTPECFHLATELFTWLPAARYGNEFSSRVHSLGVLRDSKYAEYEASQKDLKSMFEVLSRAPAEHEDGSEDKIRTMFLELLKVVGNSDSASWQANINKVYQLVTKIRPYFEKHPQTFFEGIAGLIETAFDCNFQSATLFDLFDLILREMPEHPKTGKLLIRGIKEDRLEIGFQQIKSSLENSQSIIFRELFKQNHWHDIILLIDYIGQKSNKLCTEPQFFFDVYMSTFVTYLQESKTVEVYSPKVRQCLTLLQNKRQLKDMKLTQDQAAIMSSFINNLHNHRLIKDSIYWMQSFLEAVDWVKNGLSPADASNLLKWTEAVSRQKQTEPAVQFLEFLLGHVPAIQNNVVDLIMDLPDSFLAVNPVTLAKVTQDRIRQNVHLGDSFHVRSKVGKLIDVLTSPPSKHEHYARVMDFMDLGFEDSMEAQTKVMQAIDTMQPDLRLRSWKVFRCHFRQYLTAEEVPKGNEPAVLKCLRASHKILRGLSRAHFEAAEPEIEANLDYYTNNDSSLEQLLQHPDKKRKVLDDIEGLLTSRFDFFKNGSANGDFLKKVLSLRLRLISNEVLSEEILKAFHDFDGILIEHLLIHPDLDLFMEGVRIYNSYVRNTKENTRRMVDLFIIGLTHWKHESLPELDKLECTNLMHEVGVYFWNRKHSEQDKKRVNQALAQAVKTQINKTDYELEMERNLRIDLGTASEEDRRIEQAKYYKPGIAKEFYVKVGPLLFQKFILKRMFVIVSQMTILCLILYFFYRQVMRSETVNKWIGLPFRKTE